MRLSVNNRAVALALALALSACSGESPLTPGARVAAVLASRDSISFDIGDSVLVQADARDASGNSVLDASIDWRSTDPGIATVLPNGRLAQVIAAAAGTAGIVASAGTRSTTIAITVVPPITATTLAVHTDTAWSLEDQDSVRFTSLSATGPRFGHYSVVARSNFVAAYLQTTTSHAITFYAQQVGQTWVVVTERRGTADSLLFVVRQRPAQVHISFDAFQGIVDRTFQLTAQVMDARNHPIPGQAVSWKSLDTTIARVDSTGLVTFRAVDTTAIVATHASGLADTAPVSVLAQPKLYLTNLVVGHSSSITIGVHELSDSFYAYADNAVSPWVHLRLVDTSLVAVAESVAVGGTFQGRGRRPGQTLLIAEAPFLTPDTVSVHVLPSRLALVDYVEPPGFVLVGTDNAHFTAIPLDSAGTQHGLADTLVVTFHSSNSSVLRLASDPFIGTYPPGQQGLPAFAAHAADTGRAVIYAT
ncbi:MAG TPA: Ig-like domain-containing protein, partial [Gemmatimonadales bacterium]|nr:Ig-like domain-containing protein [Gemmatimonadales bacterium]